MNHALLDHLGCRAQRGRFGVGCAQRLAVAACLTFAIAGWTSAQSISITAPAASATIGNSPLQTNFYNLTASLTSLPSAYTVEFDVPDKSSVACIATVTGSTASCPWNTYYFYGGPTTVTATALDSKGVVIATCGGNCTATNAFTVSNPWPSNNVNNTFSVTPSTAFASPWSGTVTFTTTVGSNVNAPANFYVDGKAYANYSANLYALDTTSLSNGAHEVFFPFTAKTLSYGSCAAPGCTWTQIGQVDQIVTVDNTASHVAAGMTNSAWEIQLCTVGQSGCPTTYQLSSTIIYTDRMTPTTATSMEYVSDNTAVATVSVGGLITAVAAGNCYVTAISENTSTGGQSYTDLEFNHDGGGTLLSAAHPFQETQLHKWLRIDVSSGGTWVPGWYEITVVNLSDHSIIVRADDGTGHGQAPNTASTNQFNGVAVTGQTESSVVQVNINQGIGNFATDGTALTNYASGRSVAYSSWFESLASIQNYVGGTAPIVAAYAQAGYNTIESTPENTSPNLQFSSVELTWKNAQYSWVQGLLAYTNGVTTDDFAKTPLSHHLIGNLSQVYDLYTHTTLPAFQAWSQVTHGCGGPPVTFLWCLWSNQNARGFSGVDETDFHFGSYPQPGRVIIGSDGFTGISCLGSFTTTGTAAMGTNVITVGSTTNIVVKMPVFGTGIPARAIVTSINAGAGTITISLNTTAAVSGTITFNNLCTMTWPKFTMFSNITDFFFAVVGSGLTNGSGQPWLDYDTTASPCPGVNISWGAQTPDLHTATGVGWYPSAYIMPATTTTITSMSNPNTEIIPWGYAAFDSAGNMSPSGGSATGPCNASPPFVNYNAFTLYATQAASTAGHPARGWATSGGANGATIFNWQGDPTMSDYGSTYFLGSTNLYSRYASLNALIGSLGGGFRAKYNFFGANRSAPIIAEGQANSTDYGLQGYYATISSITNGTITFTGDHGLRNIIPWNTRMSISGATVASGGPYNLTAAESLNGLYITALPTSTTMQVAYSLPQIPNEADSGVYTATFSPSGVPFTINIVAVCADGTAPCAVQASHGLTGLHGSVFGTPSNTCAINNHRGETVAFTYVSGTALSANITGNTWYFPFGFNTGGNCSAFYIAMVPSGSATGGTAQIVPNADYQRGVNWSQFEVGMRYDVATGMYCFILGCSGNRIYNMRFQDWENPNAGLSTTFIFNDNQATPLQAGAHPIYTTGLATQGWYANSLVAKFSTRLGKFFFQNRQPTCPDYGYPTPYSITSFSPSYALSQFQASCRTGPFGNIQMIGTYVDYPQTITVDLTNTAIGGQKTLKYCLGWKGITISEIAAGTTSVSLTTDPDSCQFVAYVGAINETAEYRPPTIGVSLADVPGATDVVVQYSYSPYMFSSPQINSLARPQAVDLGGASGTIPVDTSIGHVYYRLLFLNSSGAVLSTSDVQQL